LKQYHDDDFFLLLSFFTLTKLRWKKKEGGKESRMANVSGDEQ
jgi:hypothetical protein